MTVAIVDDEKEARNLIKVLLFELFPNQFNLLWEAENIQSCLQKLALEEPDLIFLDINLNGQNVFDLFKEWKPTKTLLVFITAYQEFAVKAFRFSAVDYLLKPIDPDQFKEAVLKTASPKNNASSALQKIENIRTTFEKKQIDQILIPHIDSLKVIQIANILRIEVERNYSILILTTGEKRVAIKSLKEFEELLPKESFIRVHHAHIINLKYVKSYIKSDGGSVEMTNGDLIGISRRKKQDFLNLLKNQ